MSASELRHRHPPAHSAVQDSPSPDVPASSLPYVTSYEESRRNVPWQTDNEYLTHGWRRQVGWKGVGWSLIGYLHNETVNIHSHLLGCAAYLTALFRTHHALLPMRIPPLRLGHAIPPSSAPHIGLAGGGGLERWKADAALSCFLVSAVFCLGASAWFHTVQCKSRRVCEAAHRGDYIGIVVLIVGTFWPCIYFSFQDHPILMRSYIGFSVLLGSGAAWTVLSPRGRAHTTFRTLTFIGLGLSGILPIGHLIGLRGWQAVHNDGGLHEMAVGGLIYIAGATLYAARIPEKLMPGRVNIFGSSHQLFHIAVLVASWVHWKGLVTMAVREMRRGVIGR